jgi:hypothetical protein
VLWNSSTRQHPSRSRATTGVWIALASGRRLLSPGGTMPGGRLQERRADYVFQCGGIVFA